MPIKQLQQNRQAQFPIIGKLRKGSRQEEKNGKTIMGKDLEHFRFDSQDESAVSVFVKAYGKEPKSLKVLLPFPTVDQNFQAWMEEHASGAMLRRCDGENQVFHRDERGVGVSTPTQCQKLCGKSCACKQVGRLYLIIPELARLAYVVMETHSIYDIIQLTQNLQAAFALRGNLAGVPFILSRRDREISTPGSTPGKRFRTTKSLLFIEPDPEWVQRKLIAMRAEAFAMLPEASSATTRNVDYETGEIVVDSEFYEEEEIADIAEDENHFGSAENTAVDRLLGKIKTVFNGQSEAATKWIVEGYTRQTTRDNIRTSIDALTADECDALVDSLEKKGEAIKAKFVEYLLMANPAK